MKIALTFDVERDLPNILNTDFGIKSGLVKILRILDKYSIKGTFFCTGNVAKWYPELIKLIERNDHEIACHGFNHERLNHLSIEEIYDIINQNKELLEDICNRSEIIGFRAPYLRPPKFLFKILSNLGFHYDSSIRNLKNLHFYQIYNNQIVEFPPSDYTMFFRLNLSYNLVERSIFKKNLIILDFHPWEAVNMKKLLLLRMSRADKIKNLLFRPDRWINTGEQFILKLNAFIKKAISSKAEFITLKNLVIE